MSGGAPTPCAQIEEVPGGILMADSSGALVPIVRAFKMSVGGSGVSSGHSGSLLLRRRAPGEVVAIGLMFAGAGAVGYALSWTQIRHQLTDFGVSL